jgi:hypothetical protein
LKWIAIGVLLAACGSSPPPPAKPVPVVDCARAADHMMSLLVTDAPHEVTDRIRAKLIGHCQHDDGGWSIDLLKCVMALTQIQDSDRCETFFTPAQQQAFAADDTPPTDAGAPPTLPAP